MKTWLTFLKALLLAGITHGATVAANTEAPADDDEPFSYATGRPLSVKIQLSGSDNQPMLLSFYTKGQNGQRLLENVFTDAQGRYEGQLLLPIHLRQVDLVVRGVKRQNTLTLGVVNDKISYKD
jgi:hypothetical protein